jgi:putative tricarboxylic transport membrane protein
VQDLQPIRTRLRDLILTRAEWVETRMSMLRGGVVGFLVGVLPGAGPTVASLMAYVVEKRASKHPERFGKGALDGVAAAESANNSAVHAALVPMLALGIPGSASTAVLLAALILQGIQPGPLLMTQQADLVWGLIASMFVGNVILLVLNLPMAPIFASLLRIPYAYLAAGILLVSLTGAYATTLNMFTVWTALGFGVVGYAMMKFDVPRSPLVLALVLAPLMESSLRQSLMLSLGSPLIFIQRPISALLLLAVVMSVLWPLIGAMRARRRASRLAQEATP